ncbi:nitrous oxide reductase family maturation protein NosD [Phenylobacterium sp.]|uniref:right-handed parallel beta-helix repeat-containing protein n=1 Tax=Phenylobacterium sp. TaxID=1871053 RepID=UPI00356B5654
MPVPTKPGAALATVSSPDGLFAALQSAHAGDTILLAAGTYGAINLNGFHFDGPVNIQSADLGNEAVLTGLTLNGSSGLSFNHLVMTTPGGTAVTVMDSSNVAFSALTVHGTTGSDDGVGFMVRDSSGVSITGSDFSKIGSGIGHVHDSGLTVSNNTFHDLQTDGVFGAGSSHVVISGNSFSNFHPLPGDHPDAIQLWGNTDGSPGNDVTISNNIITRGSGDVIQGIFIESTDNVTITGNALTGTMYNGISVSTTDHAVISGNFVQGFTDMDSRIVVRGQSVDVSVLHNTAQSVINVQDGGLPNPGYVASDNTIIAGTTASDLSGVNAWLATHAGVGAVQIPPVVPPVVVIPPVVVAPVVAPPVVVAPPPIEPPVTGGDDHGFNQAPPNWAEIQDLIAHDIAAQLKVFFMSHTDWAIF